MEKQDLSELTVTRVRSVSTIYTAEQIAAKRDLRHCWAIVYKWEGETEYFTDGRSYVSNATHPIILPGGSSYEWVCNRAGRYSIVEFDADLSCARLFDFHITETDRFLSVFRKLEQVCTRKNELWQPEAKQLTYQLLLQLFRDSAPDTYISAEKVRKIQPAVDYMHQNYDRNMSNEELAAMTNVSTVYFRRVFTQQFGMSPIHYLHHLRIEKAKEILCSDFGTITDVAASLGYQSIYHFSKVFKRSTGLSPTEYVKSGRSESMRETTEE